MWETFKVTVKTLARNPSTLIWCLAFPIVLATLLFSMLGGLRSINSIDVVDVAVVADDAWGQSPFSEVVEGLSQGDGRLLETHEVGSLAEGEGLVTAGKASGVYQVGSDGRPTLTLPPDVPGDSSVQVDSTVLEVVADAYLQNARLVGRIAEEDPAALADADAVGAALGLEPRIEAARITHEVPDETVRYYYALLGMVAMFCAQGALVAVGQLLPNEGPLGARRCVSGTSRTAQLAGVVLGSWVVSFTCLAISFLYIRFAGGIGFGGREGLCVAGLACASLMASGIGTLVAAIPLGGSDARSGIMTVANLACSALAGLFGPAVMTVADQLARDVPWETWANPVRLSSDLFYSLFYYESLSPFWLRCAGCVAYAAATLGVAAIVLRRQRYEHL